MRLTTCSEYIVLSGLAESRTQVEQLQLEGSRNAAGSHSTEELQNRYPTVYCEKTVFITLKKEPSSFEATRQDERTLQKVGPGVKPSQQYTAQTSQSKQANATDGRSSLLPAAARRASSSLDTRRAGSHCHSCHLCPKVFASKDRLEAHLNTHPSYCPHKCDHCSEVFTNVRLLELHTRWHHKCAYQYKCSLCLLSFATERSLTAHLTRQDPGNSKVQCRLCSKWFDSCRALLDHRAEHFAP
ncbi:myoneurin-like [Dermacentor silvarum]|uniref:myoneurin-like n=1 Tax=Dermacentor silvarum TaxID=543639 RepID=UPI002101B3BC|nr:myoneurin-like [Dermacentor silvarum]